MSYLSIGVLLGAIFFQVAVANPPELAALIVGLGAGVSILVVDLIEEFRNEHKR